MDYADAEEAASNTQMEQTALRAAAHLGYRWTGDSNMRLLTPMHQANNGLSILEASAVPQLLQAALSPLTSPTQRHFTSAMTTNLRRTLDGWSAAELEYTRHQPAGRGRRRAIDFHHVPTNLGLELELSNQTCFSHDLLKLEIAFRSGLISCAAVMTVSANTSNTLNWNHHRNSSYLTYERADELLRIFEPALTVPLALIGF